VCDPEGNGIGGLRLLFLENSFAALNIYITTTLKVDDEGKGRKATMIRKSSWFIMDV
jgi:hypothetical protein